MEKEQGLTKQEKNKLWISRVFGVLLSAALLCFLILFYLNYIDGNMFMLGMFGFACLILLVSSQFLMIKSSPFWTYFSLALSAMFALAFLITLAYFIGSGTFQF